MWIPPPGLLRMRYLVDIQTATMEGPRPGYSLTKGGQVQFFEKEVESESVWDGERENEEVSF